MEWRSRISLLLPSTLYVQEGKRGEKKGEKKKEERVRPSFLYSRPWWSRKGGVFVLWVSSREGRRKKRMEEKRERSLLILIPS